MLLADPNNELSGADFMKVTGLSSGTLYPILLRFETYGLVRSRWEQEAASELGRPRRRFYKMTSAGASVARAAIADLVPGRVHPLAASKA